MGDALPDDGELTLRVMRRTYPQIAGSIWREGGIDQAIGVALENYATARSNDVATDKGEETTMESIEAEAMSSPASFPVGCLHLPKTQGKVYAGESFNASLHLSNLTDTTFRRATLRCELQVSGATPASEPQAFLLLDTTSNPEPLLTPGSHRVFFVTHPVTDVGLHVLTCTAHYEVEHSGAKKILKRTVRFNTESLFALSHRLRIVHEFVWVEVTLLNRSGEDSALLNSIALELTPSLESHLRSALSDPKTGSLVKRIGEEGDAAAAEARGFGGVRYFKPGDAHKFLFVLNGISDYHLAIIRSAPRLGFVALDWRTSRGGPGVLKTYALTKTPLQPRPLDIRIASCPSQVEVQKPFNIVVEIINRTSVPVKPVLEIRGIPTHPVVIPGANRLGVGLVEGYSSASLLLEVICVSPGLHAITGLTAVVAATSQSAEPDTPCEVLAF